MATKIKGLYKGFKYISQIFVVKERELEIGYPTDVKHVAHIGWDSPSGSAPSWMNEFKTGPNFASTSIANSCSALSPFSSQDFGESTPSEAFKDASDEHLTEIPNIPKKPTRKKSKTGSSSPWSVSSKTSKAERSKAKLIEGNAKPSKIEVA